VAAVKLADYTRTLKGALAENKLTRYVLLGMMAANTLLAIGIVSKDEVVVMVPPQLSAEARISTNAANAALKESWASYVVMHIGNVTPRTVGFVSEQIGKIVSPPAYKEFMAGLAEQAGRIQADNISIQFAPTHVFYIPEKDVVVVTGEFAVRGMRDTESRSVRTYEVGLDVANYQVRITSIEMYEGPWSPGRDEQLKLEAERKRVEERRAAAEARRG